MKSLASSDLKQGQLLQALVIRALYTYLCPSPKQLVKSGCIVQRNVLRTSNFVSRLLPWSPIRKTSLSSGHSCLPVDEGWACPLYVSPRQLVKSGRIFQRNELRTSNFVSRLLLWSPIRKTSLSSGHSCLPVDEGWACPLYVHLPKSQTACKIRPHFPKE